MKLTIVEKNLLTSSCAKIKRHVSFPNRQRRSFQSIVQPKTEKICRVRRNFFKNLEPLLRRYCSHSGFTDEQVYRGRGFPEPVKIAKFNPLYKSGKKTRIIIDRFPSCP